MKYIKSEIKSLCHKHGVKSLYVFGSVLTPRFTDKSDVDFLVDFKKEEITDYFTNFFELKYALEQAIGREIDLVEEKAIRNPIFKQNIEKTKQMIYG
ncbi:MAG: nucleotidyltransferase domain-containing protein [Bacteroidaceae bacterium]|nr:nucleotidyltransferase domain-containing protein [Bacteroidaceae bacterium]